MQKPRRCPMQVHAFCHLEAESFQSLPEARGIRARTKGISSIIQSTGRADETQGETLTEAET